MKSHIASQFVAANDHASFLAKEAQHERLNLWVSQNMEPIQDESHPLNRLPLEVAWNSPGRVEARALCRR